MGTVAYVTEYPKMHTVAQNVTKKRTETTCFHPSFPIYAAYVFHTLYHFTHAHLITFYDREC